MAAERRDVVVVGGGIVGLATVRALALRAPGIDALLLEKEPALARHQTGRNSGVVHRGLYYTPGSQKAALCRTGAERLGEYCRERGVPYRELGKVVVATGEDELARLDALEERARANGVPGLRRIGPEELRELEPCVRGVAALHSPRTAVTDYAAVAEALAEDARGAGVELSLGERFLASSEEGGRERVRTDRREVLAAHLVLCPGPWADRVAAAAGLGTGERVLPFRGEYARLRPERTGLVRGLVYPVPDPRLPFLGVHFTREVSGGVEVGPSAVLATARDRHGAPVDLRDVWEALSFPGTWRLGRRFLRVGAGELWRARRRAAFVRAAQRLVPDVSARDLEPSSPGVRAQLVDRGGSLVDDFEIRGRATVTCVLNAPSPAATSSLAIADELARRVLPGKEVPAGPG